MNSHVAQQVLEGIVGLACRLSGRSPKDYRVKPGGEALGDRAPLDWYISVQNVNASVNTAKAFRLGLKRYLFEIYQADPESDVVLLVQVWDAAKETSPPPPRPKSRPSRASNYRTIWKEKASDMKGRMEMAKLLAKVMTECAAPAMPA